VPTQPTPLVPTTVYVVVAFGEAVGLVQLAQESVVAGLQLYDVAPEAVSTVVSPVHSDILPDTVTTGSWLTATVTDDELLQPLLPVPTTVYVVVTEGVATGLTHVAQESVAEGVQAYVAAPVAASVTEPLGQIAALLPADTVGKAFTVTVTLAELEQPAADLPVTI
jgi:hypothetical protein